MEIYETARKHGVIDEDIRHAAEHWLYIENLESEDTSIRVLYLGPDRAGNLLELVVLERTGAPDLAIHAMKATRAHEELLKDKRS